MVSTPLSIFNWISKTITYGADILHGAFNANNTMSFALNFSVLGAFCIFLFAWSLRNIKRKWIL